jgi:hypothetical protein
MTEEMEEQLKEVVALALDAIEKKDCRGWVFAIEGNSTYRITQGGSIVSCSGLTQHLEAKIRLAMLRAPEKHKD